MYDSGTMPPELAPLYTMRDPHGNTSLHWMLAQEDCLSTAELRDQFKKALECLGGDINAVRNNAGQGVLHVVEELDCELDFDAVEDFAREIVDEIGFDWDMQVSFRFFLRRFPLIMWLVCRMLSVARPQ